ncbi:UV DNA damage repair endonuclease UvsE [Bacillus sp. FJAT-44742]|uniref:UV DNA damage repair endonuclease UvsE n=1 Tax=Bacillus sp. FJAT-44742 TaxID=2014005 RepID=UPI000C250C22|nr:UV DNA damage repair endonuclease UvsE [Bacillus sp. FJAT-44742]
MRLGYPCQNLTLPSRFRTCRLQTMKTEGEEKVKELALHNFKELQRVLEWNITENITFFRISSDIVPFGSHPLLEWEWWKDDDILAAASSIKKLQQKHNMRLSVHPGQYTVLNSPKENIVENAVSDLEYHGHLLSLCGGTDMILHIGGGYGDKESAKERFITNFDKVSPFVKESLRLENDDKTYHIEDVLEVSNHLKVPACFDIHHHRCNPPGENKTRSYIEDVFLTWKNKSIRPKMHISSGKAHQVDTSHADYINDEDFHSFIDLLPDTNIDLMLEAKKKEKAVFALRK